MTVYSQWLNGVVLASALVIFYSFLDQQDSKSVYESVNFSIFVLDSVHTKYTLFA